MRNFLIIGAAGLLAACGSDSGTIETEDGTTEYSVDSGNGEAEIRMTDNDGNETVVSSGSDVEVDLPDGYSIYPGATIVSNTVMSGADGNGMMVIMTSSDSPDEMVEFYREQAEAAGIEIQMEMTTADARVIGGEGPGGAAFSFNVSQSGEETNGMLMVSREP